MPGILYRMYLQYDAAKDHCGLRTDSLDPGCRNGKDCLLYTSTGVIIENYEDETDGETERQDDVQRFQYFGNMILHQGGELGYHGYNHQPLSLSDTDYGDALPYRTWTSFSAMEKAMKELMDFGKEMFPETTMSVYVPPSNVLSEAGRKLLGSLYPKIRTIASNYFSGDYAYVQEFEVAEEDVYKRQFSYRTL